jgi:hypothetical protein
MLPPPPAQVGMAAIMNMGMGMGAPMGLPVGIGMSQIHGGMSSNTSTSNSTANNSISSMNGVSIMGNSGGSAPLIGAVPVSSGANGSNGGLSSVPSTPLSAALGPAALATLPNKDISGQSSSRGGGINFFERADRLAATMTKRGQPEMQLYGKGK